MTTIPSPFSTLLDRLTPSLAKVELQPLNYPTPPSPPQPPTTVSFDSQAALSPYSMPPKGLFEELLQSRADVLYRDVQQSPDKYAPGLKEILEDMLALHRQPTTEERRQLDLAVYDFNSKPAIKPVAQVQKNQPPRRSTPLKWDDEPAEEAGDLLSGLNPFWWMS